MDVDRIFHQRYQLERLLGEDSLSKTWLAKELDTGQDITIKVFQTDSNTVIESLEKELSINLSNLENKNLRNPIRLETYDKELIIVLPYYKNGSILSKIGKFSETEAWHLLRDIANGLDCLQRINPYFFVYPFLRCPNIMITDDGAYVLADYYESEHFKKSLGYVWAGNASYFAPERFNDKHPKGNHMEWEIYSLGCIAFEMLTGDVPFGGLGGLLQVREGIIPELKGDYTKPLQKIIHKCLDQNPSERPTPKQLAKFATEQLDKKGKTNYSKIWKRIICLKKDIS